MEHIAADSVATSIGKVILNTVGAKLEEVTMATPCVDSTFAGLPTVGPRPVAAVSRFSLIRPSSRLAPALDAAACPSDPASCLAATDQAHIENWLAQFGKYSSRLRAADVVHIPADANAALIAAWPERRAPNELTLALARRAVESKHHVIDFQVDAPEIVIVVLPLVVAGLPRTALIARFTRGPGEHTGVELKILMQASARLRLLRSGGAASDVSSDVVKPNASKPDVVKFAAPPTSAMPAEVTLELLAATLEHRDLHSAALALVNQLAVTLRADRVSLGMVRGKEIELLALSGSAGFKSSALTTSIRAVMSEALYQGVALSLPEDPAAAPREVTALKSLLRDSRCATVGSIPFSDGQSLIGAISIEWSQTTQIKAATFERCKAMLALAGPLLAALDRANRSFTARAHDAVVAIARSIVGPQQPLLKVASILVAIVLVAAAFINGEHRIAGDAVLRGSVQRVVLAPVDGFVATATARPGDVVAAGAVLATLDDQALRLEVAKWQAEYERLMNEYREAMAVLDSAKMAVTRAELDRAIADYELAADNLDRSEIRAPIAGVVVSGDYSQSLGAPVQRGNTLFEIAVLDDYHLSVRVSERDVARLQPGQRGSLLLQALPNHPLQLMVERVTPIADVVDGNNMFEVEARLLNASQALRPGMQGRVKFHVGDEPLLWLWTHTATDWLRLKLWLIGLWG
jgi:RND family efflux transporter MFP subunit